MAVLQKGKCSCCADAIEFGSTPQNRCKGKLLPKVFKTKTHLQKITRILCLLLCVFMLCGLVIPSVCAAIFRLTYYTEEIYAGGIVDLYAFVDSGGVAPFTYQWQAKGFGWIDLEDNDKYKDNVFVSVNGENCVIPRGKLVKIKRKFMKNLELSDLQGCVECDMSHSQGLHSFVSP